MELNGRSYGTYVTQYLSYMRTEDPEVREAKKENFERMRKYELPEGMMMEDRQIPGHPEGKEELPIRIYRPSSTEPLPMILDIHGGGWVLGNLEADNYRCIELARRIPAILVTVDYTLSDGREHHFPAPLMDCYQAYLWMSAHAEELGGDPARLGLHGSSAGGNLAAGLALYLRDHGGPKCALAVLNCPCLYLDFPETPAYHQNRELKMGPDEYAIGSECAYLGGMNGQIPSYYAFPGLCPDVRGLCAHYVIAAQYDTLRDDSVRYVQRLLNAGVQVDFQLAARTCHCFSGVAHPYTDLTHDMIAFAFQREFADWE